MGNCNSHRVHHPPRINKEHQSNRHHTIGCHTWTSRLDGGQRFNGTHHRVLCSACHRLCLRDNKRRTLHARIQHASGKIRQGQLQNCSTPLFARHSTNNSADRKFARLDSVDLCSGRIQLAQTKRSLRNKASGPSSTPLAVITIARLQRLHRADPDMATLTFPS